MKLFGFDISKDKGIQSESYDTFSTPFMNVGKGNLSLPIIDDRYNNAGIVSFGSDNLYPQLLNQLYYTSSLHGAIVDFKVSAAIGGGYEYSKEKLTSKELVQLYSFDKQNNVENLIKAIATEDVIHNRAYFLGNFKDGLLKSFKKVCPSKVRTNTDCSQYAISEDWARRSNIKYVTPYTFDRKDGEFLLVWEDYSLGQDVYSLPQYSSAANWMFLDGEMSYLQKSNIQNSIFPSFAMMFPKIPKSEEEKQMLKDSIEGLKGAGNAGKTAAFFSNDKEQLPSITALPTNNNDKLFYQTSESIDSKISQAHQIDPILMGIRVSGKLGSGSDIKQSYVIFEKNQVTPLRNKVESIFNTLLKLSGINTTLTINNYQIINETIVETDDKEASGTIDALNSMSPLVASKVLDNLTQNEIRALAGLAPTEDGDIVREKGTFKTDK